VRQSTPGEPIIDQFPVFEDDGYTKHSGLLWGDFVTTVWRDGDFYPLSVTVTEIDSCGEYLIGCIPPVVGFWKIEVKVPYNEDIYYLSLVVGDNSLDTIAAQIDAVSDQIDNLAIEITSQIDSILVQLGLIKDGGTGLFVSTDSLHGVKIDLARVLGLLHYNAIVDKQIYDDSTQLLSCRLRVFNDPANVPTVPDGNETFGLLHSYEIVAEYAGLGLLKKYTLKRTL